MTNAEAAAYFATLNPEAPAEILICDLDSSSAEVEELMNPDDKERSEILDQIEAEFLTDESREMPQIWRQY